MRIVSGGQTGVDRGALDAARQLGISHGGWCPRGRLAEDGVIPQEYELRETESREYPVRTERNVHDSDGTLILYRRTLSGGTSLTHRFCRKHAKPHCLIDLVDDLRPVDARAAVVRGWLVKYRIRVLNVAGPRESNEPGIQRESAEFLIRVFADDSFPGRVTNGTPDSNGN